MKHYRVNRFAIRLAIFLSCALALAAGISANPVRVRIKDVSRFKGQEKYTLVGYGLVTGLNGSGDSDEELTQSTIQNLLHNFNIVVDRNNLKAGNSAVVMVTTTIEHAANKGDMLRGTVSSVGDAKSLEGGELLLTPLLGTDAEVWATAQGAVTVGGYSHGEDGIGGHRVIKNVPTVGTLTQGVKLMRSAGLDLINNDVLTIFLNNPDFTSAVNMGVAVNSVYLGSANAIDASTVRVRVPREFRDDGQVPRFISLVEQITFQTDTRAKVVFNERTGTIVIGSDVKISEAAVAHGTITVNIKSIPGVSQPSPLSLVGETVVISDIQTEVVEEDSTLFPLPATTTVGELVNVLNSLGVKSRDIMVIFHVLNQAGALHAQLESM